MVVAVVGFCWRCECGGGGDGFCKSFCCCCCRSAIFKCVLFHGGSGIGGVIEVVVMMVWY